MPGNSALAGLPEIQDGHSTDEKIDVILNYLYILVEQMRYTMGNLGQENFNDNEIKSLTKVFTAPVSARIEGLEGGLLQLNADYSGISAGITGIDGRISNIEFTLGGLTISNSGGKTVISGDNIQSGKIEGSVLSCTMEKDHHESEGRLEFYYNEYYLPELVGAIRLSDQITGSDSAAQHKLLISSHGKFVLKLQSETDTSYESIDGNMYISAKKRIMIYPRGTDSVVISSPSGKQYAFMDDGIHFGGSVIS